MITINKRDLMLMGARSRLIELEHERLQILKMFPELQEQTTKATDRRDGNKVVEYVKSNKEPTSVQQVAKRFHISTSAANQRLLEATKKGLLKRVRRGFYA